MNELISVIIPVYNHARALPRSIASVAAQTYRPLEVIVVDDGSADDFEGAVKLLTAIYVDLRITVLRALHRGAAAARNAGLKMAAGQLVIFWDADTVARPEMLALLAQALKDNPSAFYAYSDYKFGWKKMPAGPFSAARLRRINYIDTSALIRRRALSLDPFDENLKRFQDWDLWLTLLEDKKFGVYRPGFLYKKITGGRRRIKLSAWLPAFMYELPWLTTRARRYREAKEVILRKHGLRTADRPSL